MLLIVFFWIISIMIFPTEAALTKKQPLLIRAGVARRCTIILVGTYNIPLYRLLAGTNTYYVLGATQIVKKGPKVSILEIL